jgi:hypothetical protein
MYHEDLNELSEKAKDISRALNSLKEEIEAVDWYNQRADVTKDESIKAILEHNRDEEIEHAAMIVEWLRRNMEAWDEELKTYLFTEDSITELEENEEGGASGNDLGLSKK